MKRILIVLAIAFVLLALTTAHPLTTIMGLFGRTLVRDAAHSTFRHIGR